MYAMYLIKQRHNKANLLKDYIHALRKYATPRTLHVIRLYVVYSARVLVVYILQFFPVRGCARNQYSIMER
jgi:hypothetical protein